MKAERMLNIKDIARALLAFLVFITGIVLPCSAFQSVGREYFAAGVTTGGLPPSDIRIRHTPLTRASPITQQVLILGEAGADLPVLPPPYSTRRTTASDPVTSPSVRVRVFYRFVPSLINPTGPETEIGPIEGFDPTAFAFEIDRSSVTEGFLQYRILAERLDSNGTVIGGTFFPSLEPYVNLNVAANASEVLGVNGGRIALQDGNPEDGESALDVPAGILGAPTTVSFDEVPLNSPLIPPGLLNPVNVYFLSADAAFNGLMQLTLLYPDFTYPFGRDGIVDGMGIPVANLSIVAWDGFSWRPIGGQGNFRSNTLKIRLGKLGFVAIMAGGPLAPEDRRPPQKIITPNGDGHNDTADFNIGGLADNVKVEIFDITNHRIRTIYGSTTLSWDGRDENGKVVESGVYIYQYEADGKRISGVIGVAK